MNPAAQPLTALPRHGKSPTNARPATGSRLALKSATPHELVKQLELERHEISAAQEQLQALLADASATRAKWEADFARISMIDKTAPGGFVADEPSLEANDSPVPAAELQTVDLDRWSEDLDVPLPENNRLSATARERALRQQLERERSMAASARAKWVAETEALAESRRKFEQETRYWANERRDLQAESERLMEFQEQLQRERAAANLARQDWEALTAELIEKRAELDSAIRQARQAADVAAALVAGHGIDPALVLDSHRADDDSASAIHEDHAAHHHALYDASSETVSARFDDTIADVVRLSEEIPATAAPQVEIRTLPLVERHQRGIAALVVAFMLLAGFAVGTVATALLGNF